jgi:hypothetical protein
MAWNTILVERLRYVIYDLDATAYVWTDAQLEKFLAIAAINVFTELLDWTTEIGGEYTVYTEETGVDMIDPDPVSNGPQALGNMIVAKAACIIAKAELKKIGTTAGWKVVDDKSTIDGSNAIQAAKDNAEHMCSNYDDIVEDFKRGNRAAGHSILTPYNNGASWTWRSYR